MVCLFVCFFFSSRRRHTRCALVTGVQTCALPISIDQSAKVVTAYRLGIWPPGKQSFQSADVAMMIGGNPMVSMAQLDTRNPVKRMAEAKARGLKLIVIDPRQTETAALADLFLQPLPGQDRKSTRLNSSH